MLHSATAELLLDATAFERIPARRGVAYRCETSDGAIVVIRGRAGTQAVMVPSGAAAIIDFSDADAEALWRIAELQARGMLPRPVAAG